MRQAIRKFDAILKGVQLLEQGLTCYKIEFEHVSVSIPKQALGAPGELLLHNSGNDLLSPKH